jgi:glycine/D-amino acid oxidase-like deaminating enzyme
LSKEQQAALGNPDDWGVLSLAPTGATVRYTPDCRIMIRNTVAYKAGACLTDQEMRVAGQRHLSGLRQRFPRLEDLSIEHSWQGVTCVSRNGSFLFGELSPHVYGAGCYSGSGVSKGCTLGYALADYALGRTGPLLDDVLHYPRPNYVPPRPFLDLAMPLELKRRKYGTGADA